MKGEAYHECSIVKTLHAHVVQQTLTDSANRLGRFGMAADQNASSSCCPASGASDVDAPAANLVIHQQTDEDDGKPLTSTGDHCQRHLWPLHNHLKT